MQIKTFNQYLTEASLQGNSGIPGQKPTPGQEPEQDYLGGVTGKAETDNRRVVADKGAKINRLMQFGSEVKVMQRGHEKELEELAKNTILSMYGSILDGVELDIQLYKDGANSQEDMEKTKPEPGPEQEEITDPDVIREIEKRKLSNVITQGEALNSKKCLSMPEVVEGLKSILGEENGTKMHNHLVDIADIMGFFAWQIPQEAQLQMWKDNPAGAAGMVKVEWEPEEAADEDQEAQAKSVLDSLMNDEPIEEEVDLFGDSGPKIIAKGVDFGMLLHETIKGIYELISAVAIPQDPEVAQQVLGNVDTLEGEIEDLKYGPYIAADLREFLNQLSETDSIENFREHFFGKLMKFPADQFLAFFKSMLQKTPNAIATAKTIAKEIKEELNYFDSENFEVSNFSDFEANNQADEPEDESQLDQTDIQDRIDAALDSGDFATVKRLSNLLK